MKKTLLTALLGVGLVFGDGNQQVKAQEENNPYFNEKYKTYFDIVSGNFTFNRSNGSFTTNNYIKLWLCYDCQKEDNLGIIWIDYYDTNEHDDKFYNRIHIYKYKDNISVFEEFRFDKNDKSIDYILNFYEKCGEFMEKCEEILSKQYLNITKEEAQFIGGGFMERINNLMNFQYEFNRFNPEPADKFIREQANSWKIGYENGKYKFTKTGFPIYRYLSEEEINKIESFIQR